MSKGVVVYFLLQLLCHSTITVCTVFSRNITSCQFSAVFTDFPSNGGSPINSWRIQGKQPSNSQKVKFTLKHAPLSLTIGWLISSPALSAVIGYSHRPFQCLWSVTQVASNVLGYLGTTFLWAIKQFCSLDKISLSSSDILKTVNKNTKTLSAMSAMNLYTW